MLGVLALVALEKIINTAISTDEITKQGLQSLSGKTLRLQITRFFLQMDIIFNDDHLRFEPVAQRIFEPKQGDILYEPDCSVIAEDWQQLMLPNNEHLLKIDGDKQLFVQVQWLLASFQPDIIGKLQPLIGLPLASQLANLLQGLKQNFSQTHSKYDDINDVEQLQQQLADLRSQVAQEQAKLAQLKLEQQHLRNQ